MSDKPRILVFDIETTPNLGYYWSRAQKYNIIEDVQISTLLCLAWQWWPEPKVYFDRVVRYPNDAALVDTVAKLFDEADVIVAHNGDRFDIPVVETRMLLTGQTPPSPYISVDTRKVAKAMRFPSNSLNDLAGYLEVGKKVPHSGFEIWRGCMENDPGAWDTMRKYNIHDVELLSAVFTKLVPWLGRPGKTGTRFNAQQWHGSYACTKPGCGSHNLHKRGFHRTKASVFQTVQCLDCGGYSRFATQKETDNDGQYR